MFRLPPGEWVTFENKEGNFTVEMPSEPTQERETQNPFNGSNIREFQCKGFVHKDTYYVCYFDYTGGEELRDASIDGSIKAMIEAKGLSEQSRRWIWNGRYKGREVQLKLGRFGLVMRVQIVGQKCYVLIVSGPGFETSTPVVSRFLGSFSVTGAPDFKSEVTDSPPKNK